MEHPSPDSLAAVVVDEGVTEDAVEPRPGRLGASQRVGPAHAADERLLQDVLRLVARTYPALEEAEKAGVVVEQQPEHIRRTWVALGGLRDDRLGRQHR